MKRACATGAVDEMLYAIDSATPGVIRTKRADATFLRDVLYSNRLHALLAVSTELIQYTSHVERGNCIYQTIQG